MLCGCCVVDVWLPCGCRVVAVWLLCGCCVVAVLLLCCCCVVAVLLLCCCCVVVCCCFDVSLHLDACDVTTQLAPDAPSPGRNSLLQAGPHSFTQLAHRPSACSWGRMSSGLETQFPQTAQQRLTPPVSEATQNNELLLLHRSSGLFTLRLFPGGLFAVRCLRFRLHLLLLLPRNPSDG